MPKTVDGMSAPSSVAEVLVGVADVCVDDADEDLLVLPVVAQLCQPVEIVRRTDGLPVELGDDITSMDVDHNERSERDAVVFRQRAAYEVHDVRQLSL